MSLEPIPAGSLAIHLTNRPPASSSPLKKGTGSEPRSEKSRENNCCEVPVPLFQQAVWAAAAPDTRRPSGPVPARQRHGRLERPVQAVRRSCILIAGAGHVTDTQHGLSHVSAVGIVHRPHDFPRAAKRLAKTPATSVATSGQTSCEAKAWRWAHWACTARGGTPPMARP